MGVQDTMPKGLQGRCENAVLFLVLLILHIPDEAMSFFYGAPEPALV